MKNILVIDDDESIRTLLSRALSFAGFQVTEAATGVEGRKLFDAQPPDLVVTDIIMPDADGIEFIFHARKRRKDVPIVALSGGGRLAAGNYLTMARSAGATVVYEKPLKLEELVNTIKRLLALA
jgi:DNA-binding response OmpR family regulator